MTCDILIRSYHRDFAWLHACLDAIGAYCDGFRDVIVVVPDGSRSRLAQAGLPRTGVRVERWSDERDDYLGQQVTKLHADAFSDAEIICHLDSDCIVDRPLRPSDLCDEGRPRIVMRPYALLDRHWPWQGPTELALGFRPAYDFMQRLPLAFPRTLYGELRAHVAARHGIDAAQYVRGCPPRGFSEFNALGAYAYAFRRDAFAWVDASVEDPGAPLCRWYWSWGGLDTSIRAEIETILARGHKRRGMDQDPPAPSAS